jgi:hypothetical protein
VSFASALHAGVTFLAASSETMLAPGPHRGLMDEVDPSGSKSITKIVVDQGALKKKARLHMVQPRSMTARVDSNHRPADINQSAT